MNEKDDDKLNKLLKASPKLTPPESFYRGVLEKIEKKKEEAASPVRWLWGWQVKAFATACLLMVIVLATREKQNRSIDLRSMVMEDRLSQVAEPRPPSAVRYKTKEQKSDKNEERDRRTLGSPKQVESNDYQQGTQLYNVGRLGEAFESFEKAVQRKQNSKEAEAYLLQIRQEIVSNAKKRSNEQSSMNSPASEPKAVAVTLKDSAKSGAKNPQPYQAPTAMGGLGHRKDIVLQARDMNGPATQESFLPARTLMAKKQAAPLSYPTDVSGIKSFADDERTISQGSTSGIGFFRTVVVKTPEEWQTLWQEHAQPTPYRSLLPSVDFTQMMVVGVFAGTKTTAGYAVKIMYVKTLSDRVVVYYRETSPPADAITAQMLTQPYHLRLIPKTDLPITFEKTQ